MLYELAYSAAAERNKQPILDVLRRVLPAQGDVLEVASGTGQHIVHFAQELPNLMWQPTDPDSKARETITTRVSRSGLSNLNSVLLLDVQNTPWPVRRADALVCINMIHICPWAATEALFKNAKGLLSIGRILYLYGPYQGAHCETARSNEAFDAALQAQNPAWGLRDLEVVARIAGVWSFDLEETIEMPANNLSLIFRRARELA